MEIEKNKTLENNSFIGIFSDALSLERCSSIIEEYESINSGSDTAVTDIVQRRDRHIFANSLMRQASIYINQCLMASVKEYSNTYFNVINPKSVYAVEGNSPPEVKATSFILNDIASKDIKIQKTSPREGYHRWHVEVNAHDVADRVLAWMIYLHDVPEGEGETEFLWQGVRIQPKAGTCVIWPAYFTHVHRGNPVYTCDKYIATGWFRFIQ